MRRVLFDSDILLDVLAQRQPFVIASAQALNRVTQPQVQDHVSGHVVTQTPMLVFRCDRSVSVPNRTLFAFTTLTSIACTVHTLSSVAFGTLMAFKGVDGDRKILPLPELPI